LNLLDLGIKPLNGRFRQGENRAQCPKCANRANSRSNPSLSVLLEPDGSATWNCHYTACGYKGSTGQKFKEIKINTSPVDNAMVTYLEGRGLTRDTINKFQVEKALSYFPTIDQTKAAITFKYLSEDGKSILGAKYRSVDKDFVQEKESAQILFGMHACNPEDKTLYITEGEIDAMTLSQFGVNAVSVPGSGTDRMDWIKNCESFLDKYDEYVIAVDSDEVGRKLKHAIGERLGKSKCAIVEWPEGIKDANQCLTDLGGETTYQHIQNVVYFPLEGLQDASNFYEGVDEFYEKGHQRGLKIGYEAFSDYYTIRKGELCIVTGYPSAGKSDFMDQIAVNMAMFYKWKWCLASFENNPVEHVSKIIEKYTNRSFFHFPKMKPEELRIGKIWVREHFSWITSDEITLPTLEWILERAALQHKRNGIDGLIIDPWNYINQERHGESETDHTAKLLIRMRNFARNHNIAVYLIAHPAKPYRNKDGSFPVPTMHDISGSRNFFAVTDNGIVVHRDINNPGHSEIHIQKIRSRATGKAGAVIQLKYDWPTGTYYQEAITEEQDLTSVEEDGNIFR
jgi:twinkle protein